MKMFQNSGYLVSALMCKGLNYNEIQGRLVTCDRTIENGYTVNLTSSASAHSSPRWPVSGPAAHASQRIVICKRKRERS